MERLLLENHAVIKLYALEYSTADTEGLPGLDSCG